MNEQNKKIGLYDSGVGGLTVLKALKEIMPNNEYVYFADMKNLPYGEKSQEELIKIADGIFKFFETQKVDAVVMACNTTSANVYDTLKNNYNFKIYPIIQSCAKVIANMPLKNVGVFATSATIKSHAYLKELQTHNSSLKVYEKACPEWVKIVEENLVEEKESIKAVEKYMVEMLSNKPDKIVLGCTHYPYLLNILERFAPREIFIDPSKYFAAFIKKDIEKDFSVGSSFSKSEETFFVSATPEKFKFASKMFYEVKQIPILIEETVL